MFNELRRIFGVSELEQIKLDTQVKLNDENEQLEVFRTEIDVRLSMIESHPIYNKSYFMVLTPSVHHLLHRSHYTYNAVLCSCLTATRSGRCRKSVL